jgi:hypothetical protein
VDGRPFYWISLPSFVGVVTNTITPTLPRQGHSDEVFDSFTAVPAFPRPQNRTIKETSTVSARLVWFDMTVRVVELVVFVRLGKRPSRGSGVTGDRPGAVHRASWERTRFRGSSRTVRVCLIPS